MVTIRKIEKPKKISIPVRFYKEDRDMLKEFGDGSFTRGLNCLIDNVRDEIIKLNKINQVIPENKRRGKNENV